MSPVTPLKGASRWKGDPIALQQGKIHHLADILGTPADLAWGGAVGRSTRRAKTYACLRTTCERAPGRRTRDRALATKYLGRGLHSLPGSLRFFIDESGLGPPLSSLW